MCQLSVVLSRRHVVDADHRTTVPCDCDALNNSVSFLVVVVAVVACRGGECDCVCLVRVCVGRVCAGG